jgi:hypothetical protein
MFILVRIVAKWRMLQKSNDNPFLHGKEPQKHIEFKPVLRRNPLESLTVEQRREIARKIGLDARAEFDKQLQQIRVLLRRYNPFLTLTHLCFYDQLFLDGSTNPDYQPVDQSMVELVQALILMIPEPELSQSLNSSPDGETLMELNSSLHTLQESFGMMRIGKEHENDKAALAAEMMRQQTAFIRNDGFPSQIRRLQEEILRHLDQAFEAREGFTLSEVVQALWKLVDLIRDRLNEDIRLRQQILGQKTPEKIIEKFAAVIGQDMATVKNDMRDFCDDKDRIQAAIINYFDERNLRFFYFKEEDLRGVFRVDLPPDKLSKILGTLSMAWGELEGQNPEHLVLNNPVWSKPMIGSEGKYFFPLIGLVQSFGLQMVEQFLKPHPELESKYRGEIRGDFLEGRTAEALQAAFSGASIYRGLIWIDEDGRAFENDVLVLLDTHALVFECKSGQLRARAQRGDIPALKKELEKLVEGPSRQGRRFADYLLRVRGTVKLKDISGKLQELDLSRLIRATTVNVTIEYLGSLAIQHKLLRESGLVASDLAPAATIPLHDLECILDILDTPAQAFHYLRRRAEIESANEIVSDELGLLATYLATGFDFGETEGDERHKFMFKSMGEQLVPYFMGKSIGSKLSKPERRLTGWWKEMLTKFSETRFIGWLEASYSLLSVGYDQQREFEKKVRGITREVKHRWHTDHNDTIFMNVGPEAHRTIVIAVAVKNQTREEARRVISGRMSQAKDEFGAKRILAICVSAAVKIRPYVGAYFSCPEMDGLGIGIPGSQLVSPGPTRHHSNS